MLVLRMVVLVLALAGAASAQEARSLVVFPFSSQDTLLGAAVADRVHGAFTERLEVIGPAISPLLTPLLATEEGFLSPLVFLNTPFDTASAAGAATLQGAFGADAAVSGEVVVRNARLELVFYLATPTETRRYRIVSTAEDPGRLAASAVRAIEEALDLVPESAETHVDLSGAYADYVRAVVLVGAGFANDAAEALEQALAAPEPEAAWQELLEAIRAVQSGEVPTSYLGAALALSLDEASETRAQESFAVLAEATELPVARLWVALLQRSQESPAADASFEAARYPFGVAARALHLAGRDPARAQEVLAALIGTPEAMPMAATLAASLAAGALGDAALEAELVEVLGRQAPALVYPFERRSFIAFDEGDALAAARALAVATRLAPESDLYWTNLGWAYYLLGSLDHSEEASLRAITLSDAQTVAWYNLGLVQVVTSRLDEAMASYDAALLRDDGVNPEAIEDLEAALELYPEEPGVHVALASLYEAAGRRQDAAAQFARFLERQDEWRGDARWLAEAEGRLEILSAPPPPIALGAVGLSLRPGAPAETVFQRGDRLFAALELTTEGFELPSEVDVSLRALDAAGEVVAEREVRVELPRGAVALQLGDLALDLPVDLPDGDYLLEITVRASEAREAQETLAFAVAGEASLARQLAGRGVVLRALESGAPLQAPGATAGEDAEAELLAALKGELEQTAELAEEVLPEVAQGRFSGLRGSALFLESGDAELRDFLRYVIAQEGFADSSLTFVDAYAQWALEGAPEH